jgi:hypothetical protein
MHFGTKSYLKSNRNHTAKYIKKWAWSKQQVSLNKLTSMTPALYHQLW